MKRSLKVIWLKVGLCILVSIAQSAEAQTILHISDSEYLPLSKALCVYQSLDGVSALVADHQGRIEIPDEVFTSDSLAAEIRYLGYVSLRVMIPQGTTQRYQLQDDPKLLKEMVVTGEYGETHAEHSVHRVELISAEDIEETGANELTDVLQHTGDIQIRPDAVIGSGISLQGLDDRNIKICINEVPVIGRIDGKLDLGQIDLDNIERIEIVRGPMAVSYGTDAIAGVINIITKQASTTRRDVGINAEASSEGQYDLSGRFASRSKKYGYALTAGRRFFDGWSAGDKPFQDPKPIADARRDRSWNAKEQFSLGLDHSYYAKSGTWTHRINAMSEQLEDRGLPNILDLSQSITSTDYVYNTKRLDNTLAYDRKFDNGIAYKGFVAHNYFLRERAKYKMDLTGVDAERQQRDSTQYHAINARHTFTHAYSDSLGTQFGIDGSWEKSFGERIDGRPEFWQLAGFISMEWKPIKGLLFRPGLRLGYHSLFDIPVVPSLALRYRSRSHTLRASYGHGFRAPAFKELYLSFFDSNHNVYGNTELEPENSNNLSLSHTYIHRGEQHSWDSEFSLFYNSIHDLISLVQLGFGDGGLAPFTYQNLDQVITQGGRLSVSYTKSDFEIGAAYGLTGKEQSDQGETLVEMNYYGQFNTHLSYKFKTIGTTLRVNHTYNGAQEQVLINDQELEKFSQEDYALLDLSLGKKLFDERIYLNLGVRNILDVTDIAVTGVGGIHQGGDGTSLLATGRNYFCSIKYKLQFDKR